MLVWREHPSELTQFVKEVSENSTSGREELEGMLHLELPLDSNKARAWGRSIFYIQYLKTTTNPPYSSGKIS
jgi:hypothetical protein